MKKIAIDVLIILAVLAVAARNGQLFMADISYQKGEKQVEAENFEKALIHYDRAAQILPERAEYQRAVDECLNAYCK